MTATQLLIAGLATWQIGEIWRHGSVFAEQRARKELIASPLNSLMLCPFCFSVWIAFFVTLVVWLPLPGDWQGARRVDAGAAIVLAGVKLFVHVMAVSRLANLGNDGFYKLCRTPGSGEAHI